jgi:integrase
VVTGGTLHAIDGSPAAGWLELLQAELRPDFAGGVVLAAAGGRVLAGAPCLVAGCCRAAVSARLCAAHWPRWRKAGRPPTEQWAASAPARRKGVRPLRPCDAPGCQRGRCEGGLCAAHFLRWKRAGRPCLPAWLAHGCGPPLPRRPPCPVPDCGLDGEGRMGLCTSHRSRWISHGRQPLADFLLECDTYGQDRFDLRRLPEVMRAELGYGLQRRADEARTQTTPGDLRRLLHLLPAGAQSLRERTAAQWLEVLGWAGQDHKCVARRFLTDTLAWLDDLAEGVGWDSEFGKDIWQLRRLGYPCRDARLRFDRIEPDWLRHLAKRWTRWRLSTGISAGTAASGVAAVTLLAEGFPQLRRGPQALTREILERHLAHLAVRYPNAKGRTMQISALAGLLRTARQHGWEPQLPAAADIWREDYPRLDEPAPRAISEAVMAQLESPAILAGFADPQARLLAEILMRTGLRVGDGCRLGVDCVVRDQAGAPYLRYRNHKMRREALVPIDAALADAITGQQQAVRARFPAATHLLIREKRNFDGRLPYSPDTFRHRLAAWLAGCDVRDELGRAVHVTPHQWRHTYATRLINGDVPQEVVRRLLDHSSHQMVARYARLSQQTIRAKWEAARKIDIHGREVSPPDGPLADAQWMKNNLARAKMALPNGYCGLPLQQRCEFANACLTCPMFLTTAEFLPEHRRQLEATRTLIARGEANGQARLAEMNRTVETNLLAIIGALDGGCGCGGGCGCPADTKAGTDAS